MTAPLLHIRSLHEGGVRGLNIGAKIGSEIERLMAFLGQGARIDIDANPRDRDWQGSERLAGIQFVFLPIQCALRQVRSTKTNHIGVFDPGPSGNFVARRSHRPRTIAEVGTGRGGPLRGKKRPSRSRTRRAISSPEKPPSPASLFLKTSPRAAVRWRVTRATTGSCSAEHHAQIVCGHFGDNRSRESNGLRHRGNCFEVPQTVCYPYSRARPGFGSTRCLG
jgi:hypothetical protein